MNIKIYTTSNCAQCNQTKRIFDKEGISYEEINLEEDTEAASMVVGMGYKQAPVVITDHASWSGFRLSKIQNTIAEIKSEDAHKQ